MILWFVASLQELQCSNVANVAEKVSRRQLFFLSRISHEIRHGRFTFLVCIVWFLACNSNIFFWLFFLQNATFWNHRNYGHLRWIISNGRTEANAKYREIVLWNSTCMDPVHFLFSITLSHEFPLFLVIDLALFHNSLFRMLWMRFLIGVKYVHKLLRKRKWVHFSFLFLYLERRWKTDHTMQADWSWTTHWKNKKHGLTSDATKKDHF